MSSWICRFYGRTVAGGALVKADGCALADNDPCWMEATKQQPHERTCPVVRLVAAQAPHDAFLADADRAERYILGRASG